MAVTEHQGSSMAVRTKLRERERERERNKREIWVQRLPLLVVEASCVEGAQRVLVMKVGKREISKTL